MPHPTAAGRKTRLRNGAILAGSLALHALILAALAWPAVERFQDLSNDEDSIRVTLERRAPPPRPMSPTTSPAASETVSPALQPRSPRQTPPAWVAPLGVAPATAPALADRPSATHPAPLPEGPRGDLRAALRGSSPGCANAEAVGLNRREQEHCDERLGAAARNAPAYDAPMDTTKRRALEAQASRQTADRAYRDAAMGAGVNHRDRDDLGKGKAIPWVLGAEQDGLGRTRSADQQTLKRLNDARKADERRSRAAQATEPR